MRLFVILNPAAGGGLAARYRPEVERRLRDAGVDYTIFETHARGGATELAWQAIEHGYTQLAVIGGDGTINEVLNGMMGSRVATGAIVPLAIVPLGTCSDFVKSLDNILPNDVDGAIRRILRGRTIAADVGCANGRYFMNAANMGLDAQIAAEGEKLKHLRGLASYLVGLIRALTIYRAHPMRVVYDDHQVRKRLLFACIANGRVQGGGFHLTPEAIVNDGKLDLCLVDNMRLDEIIRYVPRVIEGTHTGLRQVTLVRIARVVIDSAGPLPFAMDGEVIATDTQHIEAEVVPQAIELVV